MDPGTPRDADEAARAQTQSGGNDNKRNDKLDCMFLRRDADRASSGPLVFSSCVSKPACRESRSPALGRLWCAIGCASAIKQHADESKKALWVARPRCQLRRQRRSVG
eukprot:1191949-Prorocentrum_minimum.AAC.1